MAEYSLSTIFNDLILPALGTTIYMIIVSSIISCIAGFILAIILVVTSEDGLRPNKAIYSVLNVVINVIRSFPFIILLVSIIPLTRLIVGTSVGANAAIVPISISATSFISRLYENSLRNVNPALIEAAKSFGATDLQIIFKVIVKESVPSLVNNTTLSIISILSSTAMAGTVGAGGLGAIAITYGYQNFNDTIMYSTVIVLIILVQLIQVIGNRLYERSK